jgi:hypothetical protein
VAIREVLIGVREGVAVALIFAEAEAAPEWLTLQS